MSETLERAIARAGGAVPLLRNTDFPAFIFPIQLEFTNWRDEERSWRESVALMDLSQHMNNLFIEGTDALALLSSLAVNTFSGFRVDIAKQLVAVNHDGYVIGDGILFYLAENSFDLVGQHSLIDWVRYNIEESSLDVRYRLDGHALTRSGDPEFFRYQLQGPNALSLIEAVTGSPVPEVKFFHMTSFRIAGRTVRALRHGMAGQPGFELFGPFGDAQVVREALLEAGADFGIRAVGARAYSSTPLEAGWIPTPVPAIFTDQLEPYRAWLPASRVGSLGGSFSPGAIEDYYFTPYDLGYSRNVKFDHEFIGRAALERLAEAPRRRKVTLVWEPADVSEILNSQLQPGTPAKFLEFPKARYAYHQYDTVLLQERPIGISTDVGYLVNDQVFVSLASIDADIADGTSVELIWGESPVTSKPQVEPHRQVVVRARVAPAPFDDFARSQYRDR
ncbi:aminomethyl transferase family protein [uncultured Microbacterium sp.]|uniref:aminomethyl transferase family protein n=1 Tax=uncultured Microbacterium sp. TaxID=191216 RepID=UPI0035CA51C3